MSDEPAFTVDVLGGLDEIAQDDWDRCAQADGPGRPADPFTTYRFLKALEDSGSVGEHTGWT